MCMRCENMPFTQQMASSPASREFITDASMPPEPDADSGNVTRFSVWKTWRSRVCVSSMQPRNQGSRWPTMGEARARYTRGSMEHGPGVIIKRMGGFNSPTGWVMGVPFQGSLRTIKDVPPRRTRGSTRARRETVVWRMGRGRRNGQIGWGAAAVARPYGS